MERLKLGQLGERLKTGGAQMGRLVSGKFKEMLQTPTPESKMVDEATLETLGEPNWGMNLRICALINSEEFSGSEIVRAIKKKISGKSPVSQKLSLDLLEACAMNCEKVFSEVASEKVLDEMVRMVDNPQTDPENRDRALQLIRAWGESEDLAYMPVFQQTYMNLRTRSVPPPPTEDGNSPDVPYSLESYIHQQPLTPENYPVPQGGLHGVDGTGLPYNYGMFSIEEKKELLVVARNSLELLSSILNTEAEPVPLKEDLTLSLLEKCKESQPVVQTIVETTTDDEAMLFEALNLHEELPQVVRRYEELEKALKSGGQHSENSDNPEANSIVDSGSRNETKVVEFHDKAKVENSLGGDTTESSSSSLVDSGNRNETKVVEFHDKAKVENSLGGDTTESSSGKLGNESSSGKRSVDQVAQVGLF
ncbi:TOM1-like protein 1-like isoform X1 [Tripterygium wilfordii]|uniref:TOM1-like protein 1-like isoform X1 n=1 Tax=Tripterygium wilfordii TaxID=458696 RepID=A0A7J7CXW3_TRIWF|nr:TOM1-like protein 2 [Tripterygium wilfordii]XP_038718384.1 TOM1-like protein 2 [Tripterygium wilfordii]XP_038718385.1 TOM1-like protein 2 [Tripterygium wilfordii]KAF5738945.1 TOM1-like protein 1-like isoform X1 [Tripterygium wilfordii]